jgi:hypothetical protein
LKSQRPAGSVLALGVIAALVLGCATSRAGRPYREASADGRERLDGVELGSVGSVASLSQAEPWVPLIVLRRKSEGVRDMGNVFLATIVLAGATFGFEHLVATGPGGERILPGRAIRSESRFGLYEPRYTEQIEVPLSDDDVAWIASMGTALELRMEGTSLWIQVPPGAPLADAVRAFRDAQRTSARGA